MTEPEKAMIEIESIVIKYNLCAVVALGHGGNEFGSKETSTKLEGTVSQCNQLMNELEDHLNVETVNALKEA